MQGLIAAASTAGPQVTAKRIRGNEILQLCFAGAEHVTGNTMTVCGKL
jgi:hypothetical protein